MRGKWVFSKIVIPISHTCLVNPTKRTKLAMSIFSAYKSKQILFHFPQPNSPPQWTPFASNIKPRTPSIQEDGLKTTVPLPPASTPGGPQRLRSPLLLPSKPSQASRTMTSSPPWCRRLPSCSRAARSATASASTATPATRASPGLSARCSSTAAAPTSALLEATTSSICPTLFPATSLPTRTWKTIFSSPVTLIGST